MTVLRFQSPTLATVKPQRVYWRARWADTWLRVESLWASQVEWAANPTIPSAMLRWRYGVGLSPADAKFLQRLRERNRARFFVKIEVDSQAVDSSEDPPLVWHGTVETELDELMGLIPDETEDGTVQVPAGVNHLVAYGLEYLLDQVDVVTAQVGGGLSEYSVGRGLAFNPEGVGNRTDARDSNGVYRFHGKLTGGAKAWSTREAVEYLLAYHTPRDDDGNPSLPFALYDPDGALPDWDRVSGETDGKRTRELLNALVPRQRLLGYRLDVQDRDGAADLVRLRPFTFADSILPIQVVSGARIERNPNQIELIVDGDRSAEVALKRSTADEYEQVRCRGARRTSTGSFSKLESTVEAGWNSALQASYEAGASAAADFPAASEIEMRMIRNAIARRADHLQTVFARYVLPDPFDGLVGNGEGTAALAPLMPSDDDPASPELLAAEDLRWQSALPLREGYDYSSDLAAPTETHVGRHRFLAPLVLFRRGDWRADNRVYRHVEKVGVNADQAQALSEFDFWTARAHVESDGSLRVDVSQGPQHILAFGDFTPRPEDIECGETSWRTMIVTASVAWSAYAEGVYPATTSAQRDAVKILTLDFGERYRCDYVAPGTVLGLDPATGHLIRSTGGYLRDDREKLTAIAETAYAWYRRTRRALTFRTSLVTSALPIGALVTRIGDPELGDDQVDDVVSVVTCLRVQYAVVEAEGAVQVGPPTMEIQTDFGELDLVRLV